MLMLYDLASSVVMTMQLKQIINRPGRTDTFFVFTSAPFLDNAMYDLANPRDLLTIHY